MGLRREKNEVILIYERIPALQHNTNWRKELIEVIHGTKVQLRIIDF